MAAEAIAEVKRVMNRIKNPPPPNMNWEEIDPVSGLTKGVRALLDLIDGCNADELLLLNFLKRHEESISEGKLVELFHQTMRHYRTGEVVGGKKSEKKE